MCKKIEHFKLIFPRKKMKCFKLANPLTTKVSKIILTSLNQIGFVQRHWTEKVKSGRVTTTL